MAPDELDELLARIDRLVGRPEDETAEEHAGRRELTAQLLRARRIRRASVAPSEPV